ncbi:hypothetical protein TNCV_1532331 [Trichonephila clavipes]|nr:hypothetical protein TNCV_1532331 [Trichonephila clavipes]
MIRLEQEGDNILQCFITADEAWLYHYDPTIKQQSSEWKHPSSPTPKKVKTMKSAESRGVPPAVCLLGKRSHVDAPLLTLRPPSSSPGTFGIPSALQSILLIKKDSLSRPNHSSPSPKELENSKKFVFFPFFEKVLLLVGSEQKESVA